MEELQKSKQEAANNFLFGVLRSCAHPKWIEMRKLLKHTQANFVSSFSTFKSGNSKVEGIISLILYKWVSPGTSEVQVQIALVSTACCFWYCQLGFRAERQQLRHLWQAPGSPVNMTNNPPSLAEAEGISHSEQKFDAATGCGRDLCQVQWLLHGFEVFVYTSV